jgi:hypothetical protein
MLRKFLIVFSSLLFCGGLVGIGVSFLLMLMFATILGTPFLMFFIPALVAMVGLIGIVSIVIYDKITTEVKHDLPVSLPNLHLLTPEVKHDLPVSLPNLHLLTPENKNDEPADEKFAEAFDFSLEKNSENLWPILGRLKPNQKIMAIKLITSDEKRPWFIRCMNDVEKLDKLFGFLPNDISEAEKNEINNAVWNSINSDPAFFKKIVMGDETFETRNDSDYGLTEKITYHAIFLAQLLKIFPLRENEIIKKLFQNDFQFYNNVLYSIEYQEDYLLAIKGVSERNKCFFRTILQLRDLRDFLEKHKGNFHSEKAAERYKKEKNELIDGLNDNCKYINLEHRKLFVKIVQDMFPNTQEKEINDFTKKLTRLNSVFEDFKSDQLETFSSEDIYYINRYDGRCKEPIFYSCSETEEAILDEIISKPKLFTRLIQTTADLVHISNQITDDKKREAFIKAVLEEESGSYFKRLSKNVIDLQKLHQSFLTCQEIILIMNSVNSDDYSFHADFFTGPACQLKNFSPQMRTFIYDKTKDTPSVFVKFINDNVDLECINSLDNSRVCLALKTILSVEQSQGFKNAVKNGSDIKYLYDYVLHRNGKETEKELLNQIWSLMDSDLDFFKKTMRCNGSLTYDNQYSKHTTFHESNLYGLLKIFPDYRNKFFEKLFLTDFSFYENVLGFHGWFLGTSSTYFFPEYLPFIKGVVQLIGLKHNINNVDQKSSIIQSIETSFKELGPTEEALFLKVVQDIFPDLSKELSLAAKLVQPREQLFSVNQPVPVVTPSIYANPLETFGSPAPKNPPPAFGNT